MEEVSYKVCFKCHRNLPITCFYVHKRMGDGHLGKCKECAKKDVHKKYIENIEDPAFVEKERARGREKHNRLYKGKVKSSHGNTRCVRKWFSRRISIPADCELHHWNYNKTKSVFQLTRREHARIHKLLKFDEETKMFRVVETNDLLDSLQKNIEFIKKIAPNVTFYDFEV